LSINGNVKVKGDLCFYNEGTTDSYCLQDLIFIKSLETNTLQLSATNISIFEKSYPQSAVTGEDTNDPFPNFGAKSVLCAPNGGIKIKMTSPAGIMIDYKDTHFKIKEHYN
jgi:hypothetical protein